MDFNLIVCGVAGGLIANLTQWFKNVSADGRIEAYEWRYLLPTLAYGAAAGLAAHLPFLPEASKAAVAVAAPVLIQNLLKGASRHGPGWLKGILGTLAGDLKNPDPVTAPGTPQG